MLNIRNKNILIIGAGESGIAAASLAVKFGANVTICDRSSINDESLEKLNDNSVKIFSNVEDSFIVDKLSNIDLLIPSPGVSKFNPVLQEAIRKRLPILSELEFAYRHLKNPIIAVTGTNGKTTTTSLIGELFKNANKKYIVAGNIGLPLSSVVGCVSNDTVLIVEVSSFQLEFTQDFKPHIAIILNIAQDHIDWHKSFNEYVYAKWKIFANQTNEDFSLIAGSCRNLEKEYSLKNKISSKKYYFGFDSENDIFMRKDDIVFIKNNDTIASLKNKKLVGDHNVENLMAASIAAYLYGIDKHVIQKTISTFEGLKHRISFVAKIDGAEYWNDSKATNPHATVSAIRAFEENIILLLGGQNKDNDFSILNSAINGRVKKVILFGKAAEEINRSLSNKNNILISEKLNDAVITAKKISEPGDRVLLSPACSSFDEFNNYKERGKYFTKLVMNNLR